MTDPALSDELLELLRSLPRHPDDADVSLTDSGVAADLARRELADFESDGEHFFYWRTRAGDTLLATVDRLKGDRQKEIAAFQFASETLTDEGLAAAMRMGYVRFMAWYAKANCGMGGVDESELIESAQVDRLKGEGWRPIETAPKDGTEILLWTGGAISGYWTDDREPNGDTPEPGQEGVWRGAWSGRPLYLEWHHKPTHWMPLPAPPEQEDK